MGVHLPTLNALLNGVAAVLLLAGLAAIRTGRRSLHRQMMLLALGVSAAFLTSYLYYHFAVARGVHTRFNGQGWLRPAYLTLLLSHTILAAANLPMVLRTAWLARCERWEEHRRWARITFPIWLYVSVTGVAVYLALYRFNPQV